MKTRWQGVGTIRFLGALASLIASCYTHAWVNEDLLATVDGDPIYPGTETNAGSFEEPPEMTGSGRPEDQVEKMQERIRITHARVEGHLLETERRRLQLKSIDELLLTQSLERAIRTGAGLPSLKWARRSLLQELYPRHTIEYYVTLTGTGSYVHPSSSSTSQMEYERLPKPHAIILYGNLECPRCRDLYWELSDFLQDSNPAETIEFRHLPQSASSELLAEALECAKQQSRYEELLERVWQSEVVMEETLHQAANELNMDISLLESCREADWAARQVLSDIQSANQSGIHTAPGLVIDGQIMPQTADSFDLLNLLKQRRGEA